MIELLNETCQQSKNCFYTPHLDFISKPFNDDTIIIAFKGTTTLKEVMVDISVDRIDLGKFGKIHRGFYSYFIERHRDPVKILLNANPQYKNIVFTGHSLGGAIATIASVYFGTEYNRNIYCVTFGSPRVGNKKFAKTFKHIVVKSYRFVNKADIVTKLPPPKLYKHVKTKYIVKSNLFDLKAHKLETYCPCLLKE